MSESFFKQDLAAIRDLAEQAKWMLSWVHYDRGCVVVDRAFEEAREALEAAVLASFDFYNGAAYAEYYDEYQGSVRLAISTTAYKLKHEAKERGLIKKVMQADVHPGGHIADEVDMCSLSHVVAACVSDEWLIVPSDPAQHMTGVNKLNVGRSPESMPREQNPNDWLDFASSVSLDKTRRFGPYIVRLLQAMLPDSYTSLQCSLAAPDTTLVCIDLNWVNWTQAIRRAGGVVGPKVFSCLASCVDNYITTGPTMILCIYACTRDLVAAFLKEAGYNVSTKSQAAVEAAGNVVLVLTVRQARGFTRENVIALSFRRFEEDEDLIASAIDSGKMAVMVSRATKRLCIFSEGWHGRGNDVIDRMRNYIREESDRTAGADSLGDAAFIDFVSLDHRWSCVRNHQLLHMAQRWVDGKRWPKLALYDSDDEDASAEQFFRNSGKLQEVTATQLERQQRSKEVPVWEKPDEVPNDLWDHVVPMVVCATLKAEQKDTASADHDANAELEGALAIKYVNPN
jgi:hypothetical protein